MIDYCVVTEVIERLDARRVVAKRLLVELSRFLVVALVEENVAFVDQRCINHIETYIE